jgi:pre-rRNA-processing protein TSR1
VPALIFKDTSKIASTEDGQQPASASNNRYQLVGTGSLLGVDPTRIIAKRIILTGHPYKVHKRTATIRYMFFNQPDVDYFKPVELRTKKGRTGFIKESLGTHGYLKAGFDGGIDMMDTICLNLYKRCFPKWATYWRDDQHAIEMSEANGHAEEQDIKMA